jgi:hypothetical protein
MTTERLKGNLFHIKNKSSYKNQCKELGDPCNFIKDKLRLHDDAKNLSLIRPKLSR